jgi:hypothetical protein
VNGIRMHIAEQGEGPLIVLAHGWPELWYSWRHVLPALAAAGYHKLAGIRGGRLSAVAIVAGVLADRMGYQWAIGTIAALTLASGVATACGPQEVRPSVFCAM